MLSNASFSMKCVIVSVYLKKKNSVIVRKRSKTSGREYTIVVKVADFLFVDSYSQDKSFQFTYSETIHPDTNKKVIGLDKTGDSGHDICCKHRYHDACAVCLPLVRYLGSTGFKTDSFTPPPIFHVRPYQRATASFGLGSKGSRGQRYDFSKIQIHSQDVAVYAS